MINVTKTYLPPFEEYTQYLHTVWDNYHVTNNGPMLLELESRLKAYLGVKHLFVVNNCTMGIQIAVKALNVTKKVITTPFSFVATTSSLVWVGCKPVFADIDPATLTIDPDEIEKRIAPDTEALVLTHVFGNPCDVEAIAELAHKYGLKVIYDAAHAFGIRYNNQSILDFGDISVLSFHATKLFHCFEGGALVTSNDELAERVRCMRSFGYNHDIEQIEGLGINAKMSELHAINGLCLLPHVADIINARKKMSLLYDSLLFSQTEKLLKPVMRPGTTYNYSYYPVIFPDEITLIRVKRDLLARQINARRYFYPSLNLLNYLDYEEMPVSESVARRILCLPLSQDLSYYMVRLIASVVLKAIERPERKAMLEKQMM